MSKESQNNLQSTATIVVNHTERNFSQIESFGVDIDPVRDTTRMKVPTELEKYLPNTTGKIYTVIQKCRNGVVSQELSDDWLQPMRTVAAQLKMISPPDSPRNGLYYVIDTNVNNKGASFGDEYTQWRIKTWEVVADLNRGFFVDTINWETINKATILTFQSSHEWRIY